MTGVLLAHTAPASPDVVEEFNRWYDEVHVPEVIAKVPGVVAARRFVLAADQLLPEEALPDRGYLAIYEIEGEPIEKVAASLGGGLSDGTLTLSPTLHPDQGPLLVFYGAT
ncbi:MAG: hypothetical protein L0H93_06735 [Nocardioides sp.]|nr:hypothetical protein [Nocardioides sp.]